ncbi:MULTISPECIES: hypothetical protein, partial [unclassified Rhizobium]|uniref:hypothetical protein n=1 Tax=unclassified Rhizobium TaxID=2613769 RepID=UPI0017D252E7
RLGQIQTNRTNFNHDAHPPMVASNKLTLPHTGIVAGVYIINAQLRVQAIAGRYRISKSAADVLQA